MFSIHHPLIVTRASSLIPRALPSAGKLVPSAWLFYNSPLFISTMA